MYKSLVPLGLLLIAGLQTFVLGASNNEDLEVKNRQVAEFYNGPRANGGSSSSSDNQQKIQYMIADNGFYPFNFGLGNAGLNADTQFYLTLSTQSIFFVTDCFCNGDSFAIIVDGVMVNNGDYILSNNNCLGANACEAFSKDPANCLFGSQWCQKAILLDPGVYQIDIRVITSPYLGGTGYVIAGAWCEGEQTACCELDNSCNFEIAKCH